VKTLAAATQKVFEEDGMRALQYSTTEGHAPLRRKIAERMQSTWNACVAPDQILVTSGSQQGLDLTGKLLLDEGDVVLCESPTYLGAISAWNVVRPRWVEVETDDDGMVPAALERTLRTYPNAKAIYVIPTFQNPSGCVLSLPRRRHLLELAWRHQVPVLEDDTYSDLRYEGSPLPSLKALDPYGHVIHLSSFSKALFPGLRLGWIAAPRPLVRQLALVKQTVDLHSGTLGQWIVEGFLTSGLFAKHLKRTRAAYRKRRDVLLEALAAERIPGLAWNRPEGGFYAWCRLPDDVRPATLLAHAAAERVAYLPGAASFVEEPPFGSLRLNFTFAPEDELREGARRLGRALRASQAEPRRGRGALVGTPPIV